MKTIKYTINEVLWPYAFLLNNHNTLGAFKGALKDIFQDYELIGIDKEDVEEIKASKEIYKLVSLEAKRFYDLTKSLPYKIDVVASHEFANVFIKDKRSTTGTIKYDIVPAFGYQMNLHEDRTSNELGIEDIVWFLGFFEKHHSSNNPYEIHVNKASMCDYLLKQLKSLDVRKEVSIQILSSNILITKST